MEPADRALGLPLPTVDRPQHIVGFDRLGLAEAEAAEPFQLVLGFAQVGASVLRPAGVVRVSRRSLEGEKESVEPWIDAARESLAGTRGLRGKTGLVGLTGSTGSTGFTGAKAANGLAA